MLEDQNEYGGVVTPSGAPRLSVQFETVDND